MGLVFIGGVNGSGKTALAEELGRSLPVRSLHGTTELMARLGIPAGDYASLRAASERVKERVFEALLRELKESSQREIVLVTGHYVKVLGGRIEPSYGPWYGHCVSLALVLGRPGTILRRVVADEAEGRRVQRDLFGDLRPEERADFLRKAQRMSVEVMRRASGEFGVSGVFVRNAEGGLAAAAKRLALVLGEGL